MTPAEPDHPPMSATPAPVGPTGRPEAEATPEPAGGSAAGARPAAGAFSVPPQGPIRPASDPAPAGSAPSRRGVLVGAGVAVAAAAAGTTWYAVARPTPGDVQDSAPSTAGSDLGPLTSIPENGGTVFDDQEVVVTRGTGSTVHAFSAVCTHQGCLVSQVSRGEITCPCHGSAFDATTGAVVRGPAQSPLPPVPVKVVDGAVVTG